MLYKTAKRLYQAGMCFGAMVTLSGFGSCCYGVINNSANPNHSEQNALLILAGIVTMGIGSIGTALVGDRKPLSPKALEEHITNWKDKREAWRK